MWSQLLVRFLLSRSTSFNASFQPGPRGIRRQLWYRAFGYAKSVSEFLTSRHPLKGLPNVSDVETSLFEAPSNIAYANGESDGPAGRFEGFFRAPVTSGYTFVSAADDFSRVWIGTNRSRPSQREQIINTVDFAPRREW